MSNSDYPPQPIKIHAPLTHDNWCSGCGNGGEDMVCCSTCPRIVCSGKCVTVDGHTPEQLRRAISQGAQFYCAACRIGSGPYYALTIGEMSYYGHISEQNTRSFYPRMDTSTLALFNFILSGTNTRGDPYRSVQSLLGGWYPENNEGSELLTEQIMFNVTDKGQKIHMDKVERIVKKLEAAGVQRIVILIRTHSTPEGCLQSSRDGSMKIKEFFMGVLGSRLLTFCGERSSLLFLQACGSIWALPEPLQELENFAKGGFFEGLIGFGQKAFFPHLASPFIFKFIVRYFVEKAQIHKITSDLLKDDTTLAAHSSMFLLTQYFGIEFNWVHGGIHPAGHHIPHQCNECTSIKTLNFIYTKGGNECRVRCKQCHKDLSTFAVDTLYRWDGVKLNTGYYGIVPRVHWGGMPDSS